MNKVTVDKITYFQLDYALDKLRELIKAGNDDADLRLAFESLSSAMSAINVALPISGAQ